MSQRIIYVFNSWPSERGVVNKGIRYLEQQGYRVEIWLIQAQHTFRNVSASDPLIPQNGMRIFRSYLKYERWVQKAVSDSIFVMHYGMSPAVMYPVCRYGGRYVMEGCRTQGPTSKTMKQYPKSENAPENAPQRTRILARIAGLDLRALFLRQVDRLAVHRARLYEKEHAEYLIQQYPPMMVFDTNAWSHDRTLAIRPELKGCANTFIPSVVYNDYLKVERKGEETTEDYILYAGGALGFPLRGLREDVYRYEKIYEPESNRQYREELERFFDKLEQHYGIPVIVAAHPGVNYGGYDFGGRKIVYGRTCELTKKCKVYVLIYSLSAAYPLLWDKEVLIYYNDAFKEGVVWENSGIALAEALGLTPLNISDPEQMREPWKFASKIRQEKREMYLERYVKDTKKDDPRLYGEILDEWFRNESGCHS